MLKTAAHKTKAERREEKKRRLRSHKVSGGQVRDLARLIEKKTK